MKMRHNAAPAIGRRALLGAAAGAALGRPAIGQDMRSRTLRFVPAGNLSILDPVVTTAGITSTHGFMVFDQLYGVDSRLRPQPQMAEGHTVSDDQRTWLIRLRDGLVFHDGEKVLARDAAASISRWLARDSFGQALRGFIDTVDAADDRTIRIRLVRPTGALLDALSHPVTTQLFVMPERLARTDPFKPVTEMVGSGPYRFVRDAFVTGSHVAYARFDGYVPRQEPADFTAGGKRVFFDRVEWSIIPDPATASAALQRGEVDWYEYILLDLESQLARGPDTVVRDTGRFGLESIARFNFLNPPFDNVALRRVVRDAVRQDDYMRAIVGDDAAGMRECHSMFLCGAEGVTDFPAPTASMDQLRKAVRDAGYRGERVVILNPTDYSYIQSQGTLTADLLKRLGFTVDLQEMDFGTLLARRNSKAPVDKGGWSIFHTSAAALTLVNPAGNYNTRGPAEGGWVGWYVSPEAEALSGQWLAATTPQAQATAFAAAQRLAYDDVPFVPLGFWQPKSAFRNDIQDVIPADYSLFWNVRRG